VHLVIKHGQRDLILARFVNILRIMMYRFNVMYAAFACFSIVGSVSADEQTPILFNTNFEGASLGKIEALGTAEYRCFVQGQYDEQGRNRQATWYYFGIEGARGRDLSLTLTDLVGEYNGKPGASAMTPDTVPVFSDDNEHWQHFSSMAWDDQRKEATIKVRPRGDRIWIAHVPPYPHSRLSRLLEQLDQTPAVRVEVIGKTVQGRDLQLVTITNCEISDQSKKTV
jgi:hypothetical protein